MPLSIKEIIADEELVALTYRQGLESVEGPDTVLQPPTYPPPKGERPVDKSDPRYTIREGPDGKRSCEIDSVQSRANRMEAAYRGALADVVPRHVVVAGDRRLDLTELPHRLADAAIRATALAGDIRECFEALASGDAVPLARLAPTTLVYGAWDSRDTRVSVPRAIRSRIEAHDISLCTRSAQYSGGFDQASLGLSDKEWETGAKAGFAPAPSVGWTRGIVVRGAIVESGAVVPLVLRRYRTSDGSGLPPVVSARARARESDDGRASVPPSFRVRARARGCAGVPRGVRKRRAALDRARRWRRRGGAARGGTRVVAGGPCRASGGRPRSTGTTWRGPGRCWPRRDGRGHRGSGRWRRYGSWSTGSRVSITARNGRRRRGGCTRRWWRARPLSGVATRPSRPR